MPLTFTIADDRVVVEAPKAWSSRIKQIQSARFSASSKTWSFANDPITVVQAADILRATEVPLYEESLSIIQESIDSKYEDYEGVVYNEDLFDYQRSDANWASVCANPLIANGLGTGKTVTTIESIRRHKDASDSPYPSLIICPLTVASVWVAELAKWWPEATVSLATGTKKKRVDALNAHADVYIINYESARAHSELARVYGESKDPAPVDTLLNRPWSVVVLDEAHNIKGGNSTKVARAVWKIGATAGKRIALTGTPIGNHAGELWSILRFLEPAAFKSKTKYVARYCDAVPSLFGRHVLDIRGIRREAKDIYDLEVGHLILRRRTEDVVENLPDIRRRVYAIPMQPKQRAQYNKLIKDNELLGEELEEPIVRQTRLLQLAQATLTGTEEGASIDVQMGAPSNKVSALGSVLEDLEGIPTVIFTRFAQLAGLIEAKYADIPVIRGGVPDDKRTKFVEQFQSGEVNRLLLTTGAGATGITLTRAKAVIFVGRPYSLIENTQAEGRSRRVGATKDPITFIDIVSEGTVDALISEIVSGKSEHLREVLGDPSAVFEAAKERWLA